MRAGQAGERDTFARTLTHILSTQIFPPTSLMASSQEARILLALKALESDASLSLRRAAKDYKVPKTTLSS